MTITSVRMIIGAAKKAEEACRNIQFIAVKQEKELTAAKVRDQIKSIERALNAIRSIFTKTEMKKLEEPKDMEAIKDLIEYGYSVSEIAYKLRIPESQVREVRRRYADEY